MRVSAGSRSRAGVGFSASDFRPQTSDFRPRASDVAPGSHAYPSSPKAGVRDPENKKASRTFQFRTPGSPPPELPNHNWIVGPPLSCVNVTSVIHGSVLGTQKPETEVTRIERRFAPDDVGQHTDLKGRRRVQVDPDYQPQARQFCTALRALLFSSPALARFAGAPRLAIAGGEFAVLGLREFNSDDISGERAAVYSRFYLRPMLATVRGMIE